MNAIDNKIVNKHKRLNEVHLNILKNTKSDVIFKESMEERKMYFDKYNINKE